MIHASIAQRERTVRITSTKQRSAQQAALLEQWESYARECLITRANILRQLRAAITCRAAPTTPSIPVLLLSGHQDRLVNVKCSRALAQRWGCNIRLHPTAGHDIPLDDGEWVTQQVKEWALHKAHDPENDSDLVI